MFAHVSSLHYMPRLLMCAFFRFGHIVFSFNVVSLATSTIIQLAGWSHCRVMSTKYVPLEYKVTNIAQLSPYGGSSARETFGRRRD